MHGPQGGNIQLRRNFNDWEVDTLTELVKVLEDFKGLQRGADCLCWKEDSRVLVEVSVAYKLINQDNQQIALWKAKISLEGEDTFQGFLFSCGY